MAQDGEGEGEPLREGKDFTTAEELQRLTAGAPGRSVPGDAATRLALCVIREMTWLIRANQLPGGLAWDRQPGWRVRLWEHWLDAAGW